MTKELHVAFTKRSRFRNKFIREKNQANRDNYKIQRNLCKKHTPKLKTRILTILIQKKITDSRTFWETVVPIFKNKPPKSEYIIIINEGDRSISDKKKLCQIFVASFF